MSEPRSVSLLREPPPKEVYYPSSDGAPLGESTEQMDWIILLNENLNAATDSFVASDLFWYPVEGQPAVVTAPDVLVALGRPKGPRQSYKQWEEGGVAPAVVVEVWSHSNTFPDQGKKLLFYERHGVQEFYGYNPYTHELSVWVRGLHGLDPVPVGDGFTSPRLGVRFVPGEGTPMQVFHPDGRPFRRLADAEAEVIAARARADALAAKLRALGIDPDALGST